MSIEALFADDTLEISVSHRPVKNTGRILLSFTSLGRPDGTTNIQAPEFYTCGQDHEKVVFITDLKRSWGNCVDFKKVHEVLLTLGDHYEYDALGNSMGGFNAVLASSFFKINRVLAFAPQYSVKPDLVPWETRWQAQRAEITSWRFPSLKDRFVAETIYHIVTGNYDMDIMHALHFPEDPNVALTVLGAGLHNPAHALKATHLLYPMVNQIMAGVFSGHDLGKVFLERMQQLPPEERQIWEQTLVDTDNPLSGKSLAFPVQS